MPVGRRSSVVVSSRQASGVRSVRSASRRLVRGRPRSPPAPAPGRQRVQHAGADRSAAAASHARAGKARAFTKTTHRIVRSGVHKVVHDAARRSREASTHRAPRAPAFTKTKHRRLAARQSSRGVAHSRARRASHRTSLGVSSPSVKTLMPTRLPNEKEQQLARAPHPHRFADRLRLALAGRRAPPPQRLIIGGSTSVLPLAQKLATAYHKAYPNIPAPKVGGGQSDIGIRRGRRPLRHRRRLARTDRRRDPQGLGFTRSRATACA